MVRFSRWMKDGGGAWTRRIALSFLTAVGAVRNEDIFEYYDNKLKTMISIGNL